MIGKRYWTTGIMLKAYDKKQWGAELTFLDDGFCDEGSTQGELRTRYVISLEKAIDTLIADAKRMNITFNRGVDGCPTIYVPYDGEGDHEDVKALPKNWRQIVRQQCKRLGWFCIY